MDLLADMKTHQTDSSFAASTNIKQQSVAKLSLEFGVWPLTRCCTTKKKALPLAPVTIDEDAYVGQ